MVTYPTPSALSTYTISSLATWAHQLLQNDSDRASNDSPSSDSSNEARSKSTYDFDITFHPVIAANRLVDAHPSAELKSIACVMVNPSDMPWNKQRMHTMYPQQRTCRLRTQSFTKHVAAANRLPSPRGLLVCRRRARCVPFPFSVCPFQFRSSSFPILVLGTHP